MTVAANYQVEVAFSGQLTGVFVIGTSTIGGTDVIAGDFGSNVFDDISADVERIVVTRGRANDMSVMQQGRCVITLKDPTGKYNPENSGSTLNGYLVPMRPVRVLATYTGTTYGVFYGYISRIEHDPSPDAKISIIEAVDFFEWLTTSRPVIATQTNKTIGYIIGQILDAIGWTDPSMRSLGTGDTIPSWSSDGTSSALTLIQNLLTTDLGVCYINRSGVIVYKARNTIYAREAVATTLTETIVGGLRSSIEKDRIINGQTVTRTGGSAQTATDATSRKNYGYRDGAGISSANFAADSNALDCARFIVAVNKNPRSPTRQLILINKDAATLTQELARELMDYVTVNETTGGTSFSGRIQYWEDLIEGVQHVVRFTVQKLTTAVLTIGYSTIGGNDVIGYAA